MASPSLRRLSLSLSDIHIQFGLLNGYVHHQQQVQHNQQLQQHLLLNPLPTPPESATDMGMDPYEPYPPSSSSSLDRPPSSSIPVQVSCATSRNTLPASQSSLLSPTTFSFTHQHPFTPFSSSISDQPLESCADPKASTTMISDMTIEGIQQCIAESVLREGMNSTCCQGLVPRGIVLSDGNGNSSNISTPLSTPLNLTFPPEVNDTCPPVTPEALISTITTPGTEYHHSVTGSGSESPFSLLSAPDIPQSSTWPNWDRRDSSLSSPLPDVPVTLLPPSSSSLSLSSSSSSSSTPTSIAFPLVSHLTYVAPADAGVSVGAPRPSISFCSQSQSQSPSPVPSPSQFPSAYTSMSAPAQTQGQAQAQAQAQPWLASSTTWPLQSHHASIANTNAAIEGLGTVSGPGTIPSAGAPGFVTGSSSPLPSPPFTAQQTRPHPGQSPLAPGSPMDFEMQNYPSAGSISTNAYASTSPFTASASNATETHRNSADWSRSSPVTTPLVMIKREEYTLAPEQERLLQQHHHHPCLWGDCRQSFSNFDALTSHLSEDHIGTGKSEYICEWTNCDRRGRGFGQRQKAMRHIQTHTGDKPFQCQVCQKRFSEANIMAQHMRTHTGEKPYKCTEPGCGRQFSIS
ncbi:zinc-finger protein, partial [Haplosporangium sp. Z 11]